MKRYMLFVYETYYPYGGMNDFADSFDKLDEAISKGKEICSDRFAFDGHIHIFDLVENKITFKERVS